MGTFRKLDLGGPVAKPTAKPAAAPQGGTYRRMDLQARGAAAKPKVGAAGDAAQSFTSGALDSMQHILGDLIHSQVPAAELVARLAKMGLDVAPDSPAIRAARLGIGVNQALANYRPQTRAGRYARVAGEMAPNAAMGPEGAVRMAPRALAAAAGRVLVPTVASEGARELTSAAGGGRRAQAVASTVGAMAGGFASAGRVAPGRARAPAAPVNALNVFAKKAAPHDIKQMVQLRNDFRSVGIHPTLADVTDESGRGVLRAAASRMSPGRQIAQTFADKRALDLPDRVGKQARRVMSQDPRTPKKIAADLAKQRKDLADQQYALVREKEVPLTPEAVLALRTDHARAAIRQAAGGERNPNTRAALNRLADDALDAPDTKITVGMADSVSRALLGKARQHSRAGDKNLASIHTMLGQDIRGAATKAVPDYAKAVKNYAEASRLIDAGKKGEAFLKKNTDEFVDDVTKMSPAERTIAKATSRRAIERAAGENVGSAPGVARRIADAPEQRARNAALLGPDAADLEKGMRLEERAVQNARDIAPKSGSQTQVRGQDAAEMAMDAAHIAGKVVRLDPIGAGMEGVKLWLKSRGMTNAQAHEMIQMATDPAKTDDAIAALHSLYGQAQTKTIMSRLAGPGPRGAVAATALATGASAQPPQP